MIISIDSEDKVLEIENTQAYPGLISETETCQCELHGFEIDLNGNVILPIFGFKQNQTDHICY